MSANVRAMALDCVLSVMEDGEFSHIAIRRGLEKGKDLDKRDRAFFARLCHGTVERCIEIDYVAGCYSKVKVPKLKTVIRGILRISIYQLLYMDIPASAVCNEAVKLAKKRGFSGLSGFVNGVLRNISRFGKKLPDRDGGIEKYLSVCYSQPLWIAERFIKRYGQGKAEEIFSAFLRDDDGIWVRCNTSKSTLGEIIKMLENQGVTVKIHGEIPNALNISGFDRLDRLDAFLSGYIQVQDISSMLVGLVSGIKKDDLVIDLCAAPGGKTIHAADLLGETGCVVSCDVADEKIRLIGENVKRTGFGNIKIIKNDARVFCREWEGKADIVLADLPCSGLGVMGKKCDIKYKTKKEDIESLAKLQREMLSVSHRYLKSGGRLIFSTCTIAAEENEENVKWILDNLPLKAVPVEAALPPSLKGTTGKEGFIQVLPGASHMDGFFIAAFSCE